MSKTKKKFRKYLASFAGTLRVDDYADTGHVEVSVVPDKGTPITVAWLDYRSAAHLGAALTAMSSPTREG